MVTDLGSSKGGLRELLWLTGTAVLISRRHHHYPSPLEGLFQSRVSRCPVFGNDPPDRQHHPVVFSRIQRLAGTEGVEGFAYISLRASWSHPKGTPGIWVRIRLGTGSGLTLASGSENP